MATDGRKRGWRLVAIVAAALVGACVVANMVIHRRVSAPRLEAELERLLAGRSDSLYHIRVGGTRLNLLSRSYSISDIVITVDSARLAGLREAGNRPNAVFGFRIPSISVEGIELWAAARNRFRLGRVTIDAPEVEVMVDQRARRDPADSVRKLPHEELRALDRPLSIGQLRINGGEVAYAELARDGARPGRFRFGKIDLAVENIDNAPAPADPLMTIDLDLALGGVARLAADFSYDQSRPGLTMSFRGGLGATDARVFNSMLVDLEGFRIESGRVDTVWFDVDVTDDLAKGKLVAIYRDFDLDKVDKVTGKQSLGDKLASFISNNFKLRTANPEGHHGEPPMVASIHLKRPRRTPLIQYLWHTLRQGLATTIGM